MNTRWLKNTAKDHFPKTTHVLKALIKLTQSNLLKIRITIKWCKDKKRLPLTENHKNLYYTIHQVHWNWLGCFPDLINGKSFNEKIQWLKLFDQSPLIIKCADKVEAKDFIRSRVGSSYVIPTYQVEKEFDKLDFSRFPDRFVIKTNHDCGTVFLVKDKSREDFRLIKQAIEKSLRRPYGIEYGEWEYQYIEPKIIVEEFLSAPCADQPPDFKFHCIEGKMKWLHFIFDRASHPKEIVIERDGSVSGIHFYEKMEQSTEFPSPLNWLEMIEVAERLADGFKYLRVDLYNIENRIYVGELTPFPQAGFYSGEGEKILGERMTFDVSTFKAPIVGNLEFNALRDRYYPEHRFQE